jgi:hypothetical protein
MSARAAPQALAAPQAAPVQPLRLGGAKDAAESRAQAAVPRLMSSTAIVPPSGEGGVHRAPLPLGTGMPLAASERAYFEPRLGTPLEVVRLHRGPAARVAAHSLGASGFALDNHIVLADSAPATLAHELAHVAEGEAGVVRRNEMGRAMLTRSFHDAEVRGLTDAELQGVYSFLHGLSLDDKTLVDDPGFTGNFYLVRNELQRRADLKAAPPKPPEKKPVPIPRMGDAGGPGQLQAVIAAINGIQQIATDEAVDGIFSIEWEGAGHHITGQDVAKLKNSAYVNLRDGLTKAAGISAGARGLYEAQSETDKKHWIVAPIIKFVGDIKDPGPVMLGLAAGADALVAQGRAALKSGDYATAAALLVSAEGKARQASAMSHAYWDDIIATGELTVTVLEGVRDVSMAIVAILGIVISGGALLGVGGFTAGMATTATTIATFTPVVASVGGGIVQAAMGDKVDWVSIGIDAAVAAIMYRFGGPLANKIGGGMTKMLIAQAGRTVAKEMVIKAVAGLIVGRGATIIQTAARAIAGNVGDNRPTTWAQFVDQVAQQMLDPKAGFFDLVSIALGMGAAAKARAPAGTGGGKPAAPPVEPEGTATGTTPAAKPATKAAAPVPEPENVAPAKTLPRQVDAVEPPPAAPKVSAKAPAKASAASPPELEGGMPAAKGGSPPEATMAGVKGSGKGGGKPTASAASRPAPTPEELAHESWVNDAKQNKLGTRPPPLPKPNQPAPKPGEYRDGLKTMDDAFRIYDDFRARAPGREVGVYRNHNTGEYAVVAGKGGSVGPPNNGSEWRAWDNVLHNHPNPGNVLTYRNPSPQDMITLRAAAVRTGRPQTMLIEHEMPTGGRRFTAVTYMPDGKVVIKFEGPGGKPPPRSFANEEAFRKDWGARTTYVDPDSPDYKDMINSTDGYYNERRSEMRSGAGGQAMAGVPPEAEIAAPAKAESAKADPAKSAPAKPTVQDALARGAAERQRLSALSDEALIAEARHASARLTAAAKEGTVTPEVLNSAERNIRVLNERAKAGGGPAVAAARDEANAAYAGAVDKSAYLTFSGDGKSPPQVAGMIPGEKAMSPRELFDTMVGTRGFDNSIPHGKGGAVIAQARARVAELEAVAKPSAKQTGELNRLRRELAISVPGPGGQAGRRENTYAVVQVVDAKGNVIATAQGKYTGSRHAEEIALASLRGTLAGRDLSGARVVVVGDQVVCSDVCTPALRKFAADFGAKQVEGFVYRRPYLRMEGAASPKITANSATDAATHQRLQGESGQPTPVVEERREIYRSP